MDIAQQKSAIRRDMRAARDTMVQNLPDPIADMAFSVPPTPLRQRLTPRITVAGYVAQGSEADISKLLNFAHETGCAVALPHLSAKSAPMRFLSWQPGDPLVSGPFGLAQPQVEAPELRPDIVLAPVVAFDRNLHRLGQGGGYYDRALALLQDSFVIGAGWSIQEIAAVPVEIWDIPLHAVLTEKEWIET